MFTILYPGIARLQMQWLDVELRMHAHRIFAQSGLQMVLIKWIVHVHNLVSRHSPIANAMAQCRIEDARESYLFTVWIASGVDKN